MISKPILKWKSVYRLNRRDGRYYADLILAGVESGIKVYQFGYSRENDRVEECSTLSEAEELFQALTIDKKVILTSEVDFRKDIVHSE